MADSSMSNSSIRPITTPVIITLLLLALMLAAFFRFYKLDQIPPGFTGDETEHALDALDVMNGRFTFTSPRIPHMPMTYNYLLATCFQILGTHTFVQRALTATFSVLLIPVNFLAIRTLFRAEDGQKATLIALFSSLLLSTSLWAIFASRIGYEYILTPALALLALFFFWRGYGHGKWGLLFLASLFAAAGFYAYPGAAPFLLVIPTTILLHALIRRKAPPLKEFAFFTLTVFLLAMPLYLTLAAGPDPKAGRIAGKFIFNRVDGLLDGVDLFQRNLVAHLGTFLALTGDSHWYANLSGEPILDPILAIFFAAGLYISLKRFKDLPYLLLLIYWGAMTIPAILSTPADLPEVFYPNHFRMAGAIPPTYALIAVAWTELYYKIIPLFKGKTAVWVALAPFLLIALLWQPARSYYKYFTVWANQPLLKEEKSFGRPVFLLMERMAGETNPDAIFIFARDHASPEPNRIIDNFYHGDAPISYIRVDEPTIRQRLNEIVEDYRIVHLITHLKLVYEARWTDADPTGYLPFTLSRYGDLVNVEDTPAYTILTYELHSTDFAEFKPLAVMMANEMELRGYDYQQAGDDLFVDLVWQVWPNISHHYTVSVKLLDSKGQQVAGVDVLPDPSTLSPGGTMITYYTLPLPVDLPPGRYIIEVSLYHFAGEQIVTVDSTVLDQSLTLK